MFTRRLRDSSIAATVGALMIAAPFVAQGRASDESDALPACKRAPSAAAAAALQRTSLRDSFSLAMPECSEQRDPEVRYVHGGRRWRCGAVAVEVVWGMWGAESFGRKGTRCKTTIDGRRVLVVTDRHDDGPAVLVWYRTGEVHEPMVSVWSSRTEDAGLVEAIASSGRVTPHK
jgi:hypothetical protein